MTLTWTFAFAIPSVVMVFVWLAVLVRYRPELRHLSVWLALLFTTASVFAGVWGLMHLEALRRRSLLDWHYEERAWLLDTIGFIAGLVWVTRSRRWYTWVALLAAGWMELVWLAIFSTW
jgi:hypothetical protein